MAIEGSEQQNTLRDTVSANFDAVIPDAENPPVSTPESVPLPSDAPPAAAEDDRPRGPDGKFVPVKAKDNKGFVSAAAPKADTPQKPTAAPGLEQAAAEPPKPLARPSSWKKEMWPLWDKLATGQPLTAQEARQVAEYNLQRETEAARGVSAYKAEWDRAKPLVQAYEPHRADFERWGIDPGAQFSRYVEIHKGLALGNEDQKLGVLLRLAQDYKIPVEKLFVQKDGQIFFNPQAQAPAQQPQPQQQQAFNPQAIEQTVQAVLQKERTAGEISAMAQDETKYPHFETVRETMAQLLDAGIANDLPGAYEAALALPQHRELQQAALTQATAADEAARKAKQAAEAQRARAAAVSPRSATPASSPVQARKGLRDTIAEQMDAVGSGRV
jgi:hypothetical protein